MNVINSSEEMNFCPAGTGAQELTVDGTVRAAAALPARATHAMISVKTKAVLMSFGSDPASAGKGILLEAGTRFFLREYTLGQARFIEAVNGQAAVLAIEPGTF